MGAFVGFVLSVVFMALVDRVVGDHRRGSVWLISTVFGCFPRTISCEEG